MSDRELIIKVEDGYVTAYATRIRDGQRSGVQYGCQGRETENVMESVCQLFAEFLTDEIPEGGLWRRSPDPTYQDCT